MTFRELDGRLFAIDKEASKGFVWQEASDRWAAIAPGAAAKAWIEGQELTPAQAEKRYPAADFESKDLASLR